MKRILVGNASGLAVCRFVVHTMSDTGNLLVTRRLRAYGVPPQQAARILKSYIDESPEAPEVYDSADTVTVYLEYGSLYMSYQYSAKDGKLDIFHERTIY